MNYLNVAWNYFKGKKSYFVAAVAILYGFLYNDKNALLVGLATFGLRHALVTEINKIVSRKK